MDHKLALAQTIALLYPGDKIAAIKLIRSHMPAFGLKDAKELVEEIWRCCEGQAGQQVTDTVASLLPDAHFSQEPAPPPGISGLPPDWKQELARFYPNQKIQAVKYVRDMTGLGLKEAKDLVEQTWDADNKPAVRMVPKAPQPSAPTGDTPDYEVRSSGLPLQWIALAIAAAAAASYFFGR